VQSIKGSDQSGSAPVKPIKPAPSKAKFTTYSFVFFLAKIGTTILFLLMSHQRKFE